MRSDQDKTDVNIDVNGKVSIRCSGKAIYGRFRHQGEIRWRVRRMTLKGGEPITGAKSRVGLTSPSQLDTGGIEVRLTSGESLLESREEGRRRKEGVCQEDTGVMGIYFRNGLFPDTGNPPASVFCAHFSDNPGTLSLSGGVCTTPYLDSIEFTA